MPERFAAFVEATNQNFHLVNQRLDRLEADVSVLKTDMAGVKGILDNLCGSDYELQVENSIGSLAGEYLRIRRTRVLKGPRAGLDYEFTERVEDAEDNGIITEEQNHELGRSDLIFA